MRWSHRAIARSSVLPSDGSRYHAIFKDDSVGAFVARHHIDADEYQREFDRNLAEGRMPIAVRAAGRSADNMQDLYGAVFANDDIAEPRYWTLTGTYQPRFAYVEMLVRSFMQLHGIRAGSLAIAQSGRLLCSRAFTYAEAGYPVCHPNSWFRLASLSKLFTAAGIAAYQHSLPFPQNLLLLNRHIFPMLGITAAPLPGQTADGRINTITLRELVDHTGGWTRDVASPTLHPGNSPFDPCSGSGLRTIGGDYSFNHVPSAGDVARYMFGEPLQFTPGDSSLPLDRRYSNLGTAPRARHRTSIRTTVLRLPSRCGVDASRHRRCAHRALDQPDSRRGPVSRNERHAIRLSSGCDAILGFRAVRRARDRGHRGQRRTGGDGPRGGAHDRTCRGLGSRRPRAGLFANWRHARDLHLRELASERPGLDHTVQRQRWAERCCSRRLPNECEQRSRRVTYEAVSSAPALAGSSSLWRARAWSLVTDSS